MNEHKSWIGRLFGARAARVKTAAGFQHFLSSNASFVGQKTVTEYCQAKAGRMWAQLATEAPFIEGLTRARWEGYAAVLEDVVVIAEGFARPFAGGRAPELGIRLFRLFADALDAQGRAPHRPEGWQDVIERARPRLAAAHLAEPVRPFVAAQIGGHRMFEALPFHPAVRRLDEPMIVNSVAFQLVAFLDRMRRECDGAAVTADLLASDTVADDDRRPPGPRAEGG